MHEWGHKNAAEFVIMMYKDLQDNIRCVKHVCCNSNGLQLASINTIKFICSKKLHLLQNQCKPSSQSTRDETWYNYMN